MGKHNPQTHLIPLLEVSVARLANPILSRFAVILSQSTYRDFSFAIFASNIPCEET